MSFARLQPQVFKIGDHIEYVRDKELHGVVTGVWQEYYTVRSEGGKSFNLPKDKTVAFCQPMPKYSSTIAPGSPSVPIPDPWPENPRVLQWKERFVQVFNQTGKSNILPDNSSTAQFMGFCLFQKWLKKNSPHQTFG